MGKLIKFIFIVYCLAQRHRYESYNENGSSRFVLEPGRTLGHITVLTVFRTVLVFRTVHMPLR